MVIRKRTILLVIFFAFILIGIGSYVYSLNLVYLDNGIILDINIDDILSVEEPKEEKDLEETFSDNPPQVETIPVYNSGAKCLDDAINRIQNANSYKISATGKINAMGVVQNIRTESYKLNNENFEKFTGYSSAPFGKTQYREIYSSDNVNCSYKHTSSVNADMTYNGSLTSENKTVESIKQDINSMLFEVFDLVPKSNVGKITKFDKLSNKDYYIINYSYNLDNLPNVYIENMKKEGGLSSITFTVINFEIYISKTTGQIKVIKKDESYNLKVSIISGSASSSLIITFTDINTLKGIER